MLMTRVLSQAKSWFQSFRRVFVYSDAFPNTTKKEIREACPHATIEMTEITNQAEHVIGSQWTNPWYLAQPRFLPALEHLWRSNPNVRWYVVGDDDTYLYPKNILRRLGKHNSSEPEVVSFFWCTWNTITDYMEPQRDCHPFAQGGSGVLFSKTIMDLVGPHLIECNEKYNDAEHAASMRVSVCMERLFGYENWSKGAYIKPWKSGIHPGSPKVVISHGNTWDAPASFHQVKPDEMENLKRSHMSDVKDGFVDWSYFSFRSVPVELTRNRWWQMHFGYAIDNYGTHTHRLYAISLLETSDDGKTYVQKYDGNVTVVVHCDATIPENTIEVDDVERGPESTIHLLLDCPKPQPYYK